MENIGNPTIDNKLSVKQLGFALNRREHQSLFKPHCCGTGNFFMRLSVEQKKKKRGSEEKCATNTGSGAVSIKSVLERQKRESKAGLRENMPR